MFCHSGCLGPGQAQDLGGQAEQAGPQEEQRPPKTGTERAVFVGTYWADPLPAYTYYQQHAFCGWTACMHSVGAASASWPDLLPAASNKESDTEGINASRGLQTVTVCDAVQAPSTGYARQIHGRAVGVVKAIAQARQETDAEESNAATTTASGPQQPSLPTPFMHAAVAATAAGHGSAPKGGWPWQGAGDERSSGVRGGWGAIDENTGSHKVFGMLSGSAPNGGWPWQGAGHEYLFSECVVEECRKGHAIPGSAPEMCARANLCVIIMGSYSEMTCTAFGMRDAPPLSQLPLGSILANSLVREPVLGACNLLGWRRLFDFSFLLRCIPLVPLFGAYFQAHATTQANQQACHSSAAHVSLIRHSSATPADEQAGMHSAHAAAKCMSTLACQRINQHAGTHTHPPFTLVLGNDGESASGSDSENEGAMARVSSDLYRVLRGRASAKEGRVKGVVRFANYIHTICFTFPPQKAEMYGIRIRSWPTLTVRGTNCNLAMTWAGRSQEAVRAHGGLVCFLKQEVREFAFTLMRRKACVSSRQVDNVCKVDCIS
eukprot:1136712-Pelagomonas_calceolata.AAC.2